MNKSRPPLKANRAAAIYAAIGGTAANQAIAIQLGWQPDRKAVGPVHAAGTKLLRNVREGTCTVRHRGPFDLSGNRQAK